MMVAALVLDGLGIMPQSVLSLLSLNLVGVLSIPLAIAGLLVAALALFEKASSKTLPLVGLSVSGVTLAFSVVLVVLIQPGVAKARDISIVTYGQYEIRGDSRFKSSYVQISVTDTIPAAMGANFGLEFVVHGNLMKYQVSLKKRTIIPAPGLWDSTSHSFRTLLEKNISPGIGDTSYVGFGFDEPPEMLPGVWTMQLWFRNKLLAEKSFVIVRTD